jgi:transcriptional regulator with PAS, ATPase and Fis domain
MKQLFSRIERVAPHYRTALVTGETGTGKELAARAVHDHSPVARGPYVTCNCASFTDTLFESEVFGYVKGAFTGALQNRTGLIASADRGTLFLDEVGELPLSAQAKLLRVLQAREVRPVGATRSQTVDIRVIGATNRNLRAMVEAKTFREDLYYRLAMLELPVPPLRDRPDDIPLLARYFVRVFAEQYSKPKLQLELRALMALVRYPWPGNVRELENVLGTAALMADDDTIDVRHLPIDLGQAKGPMSGTALRTLAESNHQHVRFVLRELRGNRRRAAQVLGISRATLYRLLHGMGEQINADTGSEDSRLSLTSVSATE